MIPDSQTGVGRQRRHPDVRTAGRSGGGKKCGAPIVQSVGVERPHFGEADLYRRGWASR